MSKEKKDNDTKWSCPQSKTGLHNFPMPGVNCTRCGVNQDRISGRELKSFRRLLGNATN